MKEEPRSPSASSAPDDLGDSALHYSEYRHERVNPPKDSTNNETRQFPMAGDNSHDSKWIPEGRTFAVVIPSRPKSTAVKTATPGRDGESAHAAITEPSSKRRKVSVKSKGPEHDSDADDEPLRKPSRRPATADIESITASDDAASPTSGSALVIGTPRTPCALAHLSAGHKVTPAAPVGISSIAHLTANNPTPPAAVPAAVPAVPAANPAPAPAPAPAPMASMGPSMTNAAAAGPSTTNSNAATPNATNANPKGPEIAWTPETDPESESIRRIRWIKEIFKRKLHILKTEGRQALTLSDLRKLLSLIEELAFHPGISERPYYIVEFKYLNYLRKLSEAVNFGDHVAEAAHKLRNRWMNGDYNVGSVLPTEDLESSEDEEMVDPDRQHPAGSGRVQIPQATREHCENLMRGILSGVNKNGGRVYRLQPGFTSRPADVWGHNDLEVGQWWPYQICALRDGAHGARMGGIYGKSDAGAYSIVVAGGDDYKDKDRGETLYYSGSHGAPPGPGDTDAQLTNATKQLTITMQRGRSVRVLRKGPTKSQFAPRAGLRYDGLYRVTNREIVTGRDATERNWYKFTLQREPGQKPLEDLEVSRRDYSAWAVLTGKQS